MKEYVVLDSSLTQVSQGDTVYKVVGGFITMPAEIAHDLVQSGQITLASNVKTEGSPESVVVTNPGEDQNTDEGAGEDEETDGGEKDE